MGESTEAVTTATSDWWRNTSYEDAKTLIRNNMASMARNSVAIGYYLRSVREKEQYLEEYQSFEDFVRSEYSMSYSAATRLIALCEKFSRDGNSPVLAEEYRDYSKSLLIEMLPMSDEQLERVEPGMTVAEVRELKRESVSEEPMPTPEETTRGEEPELIFQLQKPLEEDPERPDETIAENVPIEDMLPEPEETAACNTGLSGSGVCGVAAYCDETVSCCIQCQKDCSIRCGWIEVVEQDNPCRHYMEEACDILSDTEVQQPCIEGPCPMFATSQAEGVFARVSVELRMEVYGEPDQLYRSGNVQAARQKIMDLAEDTIKCGDTSSMSIISITSIEERRKTG